MMLIPWIIRFLAGHGVQQATAEKAAKPLLIFALLLALAGLAWGAVAIHDRRVVTNHDATQTAVVTKADQKADAHAADARVADTVRQNAESTQIKEAVSHAKATGTNPRAAYYACIRVQQDARARHIAPADC